MDPAAAPRLTDRRFEWLAAGVCLLSAVALTWPMAAHFTSALGGDPGDPFQTLWAYRWVHDALVSLKNPFFTDRVFYPHGAPLVFQTFDLPTTLLLVPFWWVLPPFGVYNLGVLFGFWLTAFGLYRLAKELTGDRLVALAAGVVFSATPYHLAHVQGHQHLVSMGWLPLYLVHLHRMLEGRARTRDAALGGLFLALASLASWYHLLDAMVLTPVLFAWAATAHRRAFLSRLFLKQALALAAAFLVVAGPLIASIFYWKNKEPISGSHDAVRFSGDLYAFFLPNLAQGWGHWLGGHAFRWTGNAAETALYAGYALLLCAVVGAAVAGSRARAYLAMALLGAVLALGPVLHVDGRVLNETHLPYGWLERALPPLQFMGVPVRLGYVMYLGLVLAAALGLASLRARLTLPALRLALLAPFAVTLVEYAPRHFIDTRMDAPPPLVAMGDDPSQFAVLDLSDWYRQMWHAALHRHPMTGGNLSRVPTRLERWFDGLPLVRGLRSPSYSERPVLTRREPRVDFDWGGGSPDPAIAPDRFRATYRTTLELPRLGYWTFFLTSDDGSRLSLDERVVIDNGGMHPAREAIVHLRLHEGPHPLALDYEEVGGGASLKLEWEGPEQPREVVPPEVVTSEGAPGWTAEYRQLVPNCGLTREQAQAELQRLSIRYVIVADAPYRCLEQDWGLAEIWRGDGLRIYERR